MSTKYMKKGDASDYISIKRQQAMYAELSKNALIENTTNPLKKDGVKYNDNLLISKKSNADCCAGGGRDLQYAKNYNLKMDYYNGKIYRNYKCAIPTNQGGTITNGCYEVCMCFKP